MQGAYIGAKRYRAVTWQRSIERTDDSRSGSRTTSRNAERAECSRLMFFERGLEMRATRMPPTSTQSPTDLRAGGASHAFPRIAELADRPSW